MTSPYSALASEAEGSPPDTSTDRPARVIQGRSTWQLAWARFRKDRAALASALVILLVVLMAVFAPAIAALTGHGVNQQYRTTGLSAAGLPVSPNTTFLLGTDDLGRDLFVRIAYGARISLFVGVVATLATVAIGAVLGLIAGYLGGFADTIIARLVDLVLSFPFLLFGISLVSVTHPGLGVVILVIAVFGWAAVARVVRGQVLTIREKEYIEAARSLGASAWRIMFIDVLPNVMTQLIVYATLLIPVSIILEATLSFLGVGIPPPAAEWGQMIAESESFYQQSWWFLVFPSAVLLVTTVAFNILGDGVRDALDPRLERL